jgi:hypothetical protein
MTNPVPESDPRPISARGRPHGRMSSWILVTAVLVAFICGGIAMVVHAWGLFWICLAVIVLSVPVGRLIGIMDDTMAWTHAIPARYEGSITREAERQMHEERDHPSPHHGRHGDSH